MPDVRRSSQGAPYSAAKKGRFRAGSFWATGMLTAVNNGTSETDILRDSP